jgi:DNA-directed RNA polymerase subunit RPC12/RpoP
MERSVNSTRLDIEDLTNQSSFRCNKCNETFEKPLLATLSSRGYVQKYYACPQCLSKVMIIKRQRGEETKEVSGSTEIPRKTHARASEVKEENDAGCQHFFGYLKKRPKDKSFPEECLTCNKMVECMVR